MWLQLKELNEMMKQMMGLNKSRIMMEELQGRQGQSRATSLAAEEGVPSSDSSTAGPGWRGEHTRFGESEPEPEPAAAEVTGFQRP